MNENKKPSLKNLGKKEKAIVAGLAALEVEGVDTITSLTDKLLKNNGVKIQIEDGKVTLDVVSPKFSKYPFYMKVCEGKLPRLIDVKGYEGVLIHVADGIKRDALLQGCIGIGNLSSEEYLINGKQVFTEFYNRIKGNDVELEIL